MTHKMYTDGGARGNPGPAGAGVVILDPNGISIVKFSKYLGVRTNNEAEYGALIVGLTLALKNDIKFLQCYLDSELVVNQLNGKYKVKNERLKSLYAKAIALLPQFSKITFVHIPRAENSEADLLVNEAVDNAEME